MIFARHAHERYRQFHMLDRPDATDEDAKAILENHADQAVRLPAKTVRGDEVWTIHALGIEMVIKRDEPGGEPVCVTVLPPTRFRGLTPEQVERIEDAKRSALTKVASLDNEASEVSRVAVAAAVVDAKPAPTSEERSEAARLAQRATIAKNEAKVARADADTLCNVLKTMRTQLCQDRNLADKTAALRLAMRFIARQRSADAVEVLREIAGIDDGFLSPGFLWPDREGS